jgi:hypothetical protein
MTANEEDGPVGWGGWGQALVLTLAVTVLAAALTVGATRRGDRTPFEAVAAQPQRAIVQTTPPASTTTTDPPTTTTTSAPNRPQALTEAPTPPRDDLDTRATITASIARHHGWTLRPYEGVGVWLDVYDWTKELTGGRPQVLLSDIDRMAKLGIQTIYIQTAHRRSAADVIEPDRLRRFIDRAHDQGMKVVAWYLPNLENVTVDLRRLVATTRLPVDGLGVDIESLAVADPAERTRRLLALSTRLRTAVGDRSIAAITPSAVHLQVINPAFWPGFPWPQLASTYDVILPMSYWSVRRPEWHSGERYIGENIDRIRASTGQPDIPIHAIGGVADAASVTDVKGMVHAIQARGILGGSLYDWNTSQPAQWKALRPLRSR